MRKRYVYNKKRNRYVLRASNSIDSAAPASVWGKGVPGKGGMTTNFLIVHKEDEKDVPNRS